MQVINVAKLIIHAEAKVLILRISGTHSEHAYMQDLPGGIIEKGEYTEQGMLREVAEEAGINLGLSDVSPLYATTEVVNKNLLYTHHIYLSKLSKQVDVKLSWEHDEFNWLTFDEITNLTPTYQHGIEFIKNHGLI